MAEEKLKIVADRRSIAAILQKLSVIVMPSIVLLLAMTSAFLLADLGDCRPHGPRKKQTSRIWMCQSLPAPIISLILSNGGPQWWLPVVSWWQQLNAGYDVTSARMLFVVGAIALVGCSRSLCSRSRAALDSSSDELNFRQGAG